MKPVKLTYWRAIVATLALLMVLLASPALADKYWVGPTSNDWWSNPMNWDIIPTGPGGDPPPVAGENAFLTNGTTATVDATSPPLLNSVIVDGNFTATQAYWPSGNLSASAETIGLDGVGVYNHNAGSNTVGSVAAVNPLPAGTLDRTLVLGFNDGSSGTYNKSSSSTLTVWDLMVGRAGTGEFNQPSGNLTIDNDLILGRIATTGIGTFNMSSGVLQVGRDEIIGFAGVGNLTHTSGSHTIGRDLLVGRNSGSTGNFTMTSGSLQVGRNEIIGRAGDGSLTHTSGSHTIGNNFILGRDTGTTGNFTMTSGSLNVGNVATIGNFGTGNFTMTSGSFTVAKKLWLARNGGTGTFTITSGSVTSNNTPPFDGTTDIQINSAGTFNVNGGATVTGDVVNDGTVKTTGATVTWNGDFTNNNAYISDPSTQNFNNDLVVGPDGYIQATKNKDLFRIRGDFENNTTDTVTTSWNTAKARLVFAKGGEENDKDHNFYIVGEDNGPSGTNAFAWRLLNVNKQNLYLSDPDGGGGALYVEIIKKVLFSGTDVTNIFTDDPINIYYNETKSGFSGIYALGGTGGGQLIGHTPLPPSVLLMGSGLLGLGLLGWRRKKRG